jgi:chaperone required for assembly of F1-ATPase
MRRFWTDAAAGECEGGFGIRLDGKPVRTPAGAMLVVPARGAAEAIAAEWRDVGGAISGPVRPAALPLTRLASTAIDRIAPDPAATVAALARYAETDLVCYRAEQPPELAARQQLLWQPHLDWAASALDAPLALTRGIMPLRQDVSALAALGRAVARFDPFRLAGLALAVGALGSLVLGLALAHGRLDATAATEASLIDEIFQSTLWGEDSEAAARRLRIAEEVVLASRFIALFDDGPA